MSNYDPTREESVSINEAAEITRVSRRTIYNWIESNRVQYFKTVGGSIRIVRASLFISDARINCGTCGTPTLSSAMRNGNRVCRRCM